MLAKVIDMLFARRKRIEHGNRNLLQIIMEIEGQISSEEAERLMDLASRISAENVIVEIGSYKGRSSIALAFGTMQKNGNRVYAVDPHVEYTGILGAVFGPGDQADLYKNIVEAGVGKVVTVVSLHSVCAAKSWTNQNIGLLWIDGDHSYNGVRADFEAWEPYVVKNGIVAFHDSQVDGVKKLIEELVLKDKIHPLGTVDTLSWFSTN